MWYLSVTAFFTVYYCGWLSLLAMLSSVILLYEISLAKRPLLCWGASILLLICLSIFQIPMVFVIIMSFDFKSFELLACVSKPLL